MLTYKNILKSIACAGMICLSYSCGSGFLDINTDPNNASRVVPNLMLPVAQASFASAVGDGPNGFGNPAGVFVHQHTQRSNIDGYGITTSSASISNGWRNAYDNVIELCNQIIKVAEPQKNFTYSGIAKIQKAVMFAYLVDMFANVPYYQANNPAKYLTPKYDNGSDVYNEVLKLLDEGIADLAKPSFAVPSKDDIIYNGSVIKWRKFAKSFKLRLYNQMRNVRNVKTEITTLLTDNDLISSHTEGFNFLYGALAAPENRHPLFTQDYNATNRTNYISPYFFEILADTSATVVNGKSIVANPIYKGIKDPRLPYYVVNPLTPNKPAQNPVEYRVGAFVSIYFNSGGVNRDFDQSVSRSVTGIYTCGGKYDDGKGGELILTSGTGSGYQRILPYHSLLFIRAELAQVGISNENPRTLLSQAIDAAFTEVNNSAGTAPRISTSEIAKYKDAVLARYDGGTSEQKLEHILTQKWIANYGSAVESYNDIRRTGYPKPFQKGMPGIPSFVLLSARDYPHSLPYSQNELNANPDLKQKLISTPEAKVFWQK